MFKAVLSHPDPDLKNVAKDSHTFANMADYRPISPKPLNSGRLALVAGFSL